MTNKRTRHPGIVQLDNGKFRARYRDGSGKEPTQHFDKIGDAVRWRGDGLAAVRAGTHRDPRGKKVTFKEYGENWRAGAPHGALTRRRYEQSLRLHAYPAFGDQPVDRITHTMVQNWVSALPVARSTKRNYLNHVSAVFKSAVLDRLVTENPCAQVKVSSTRTLKRVWIPTDGLVAALERALPDHLQAIASFAADSGLRQAELHGVEVDQIDFLRRKAVDVRQQWIYVGKDEQYLAAPKYGHVREVPLDQETLEALAAHLAAFPPVPVKVHDRTNEDPKKWCWREARFVFQHKDGGPISRASWQRIWVTATAQVTKEAKGRSTDDAVAETWPAAGGGVHKLRHYYASALIRAGCSVKTVQERLGHADATVTLRTYLHLWPDADDQTREAVRAARSARSAMSRGNADSVRTQDLPG